MSRKKISTTVYLTIEQAEKLAELQRATKVPTAERIRQAIDRYLADGKLTGMDPMSVYEFVK